MRLDGRRESENFEDRRGMSTGMKAGIGGIGGIIMVVLFSLLGGGNLNLGDILQQVGTQQMEQPTGEYVSTPEEEAQVKFCKQVLASTEDVWTEVFRRMGKTYTPPTIVFFTNSVQSACGGATSAVGPFYCSGDQKLYIDLSFFKQMETQLNSGGDFARAYVIAHEVGHHVENLLGILGKCHAQMQQSSKAKANQLSVRLELLADYYAGVWGYYEDQNFNSIDDSDIRDAINCAQHIGDNYLQEKAQGYSQPESFTHGTSAQRMKWLRLGLTSGRMGANYFPTFEGDYSSL
ncbi:MAG: zinc metallopeptidase [Prevotella sp.]|nr:zinc metallopeptidase [Prevotella sp.]MBR3390226.1 zinc metallopeptidase [Prevotella sp.]MBR3445033.1 zinc metallopeptidase [Prevotella sp.]